MTSLYIWLILNVFMGIMYWVLICQTKDWFNIFLFPMIGQNLRESGYSGFCFDLAYFTVILFTLPYIIVHFVFLILFTAVILIVDTITEKKKNKKKNKK